MSEAYIFLSIVLTIGLAGAAGYPEEGMPKWLRVALVISGITTCFWLPWFLSFAKSNYYAAFPNESKVESDAKPR